MDEYSKQERGREKSVGRVAPQLARFQEPFTFDSGATIPNWEICYEAYGKSLYNTG